MSGNNTSTTNFLNPHVLNMTVTKRYFEGIDLVYAVTPVVADCRVGAPRAVCR